MPISVIIPAFNAERYLAEALESVFAQTQDPGEVWVVDDGSTDGTSSVARAFSGVTVLRQENRGVSSARNAAIRRSTGELVAFLDADDRWLPEKLERQSRFMADNPGLGSSVTRMRIVAEAGMALPPGFRPEQLGQELVARVPSALMVRRPVFDQIGLFDETFRRSEDADWFLRAKEAGVELDVLDEVLLEKRLHDANLTYGGDRDQRDLLRSLRASIKRRRAGGRAEP